MTKASSACKRALALTFLWISLLFPRCDNYKMIQMKNVMLLRKSLELSSPRQLPSEREEGGLGNSAFCCSNYCAVTLGKH